MPHFRVGPSVPKYCWVDVDRSRTRVLAKSDVFFHQRMRKNRMLGGGKSVTRVDNAQLTSPPYLLVQPTTELTDANGDLSTSVNFTLQTSTRFLLHLETTGDTMWAPPRETIFHKAALTFWTPPRDSFFPSFPILVHKSFERVSVRAWLTSWSHVILR